MEVGSVSSSASLLASAQVRARPTEQERQPVQAQQTQQAQEAKAARTTQSERAVTASASSDRARLEAESSRPSVNTSGQVVGQRINVTA